MKFFITVLLFLSVSAFAQNYKQISIKISDQTDLIKLSQTGVDIEHSTFDKNNNLTFFVNENDLSKISAAGFSYSVLINNWNEYYNSLQKLTEQDKQNFISDSKRDYNVDGFGFGSMGGYYTYDEIAANLDSMYAQFPNLITPKFSIGTSQQARTIWAVRISDNPTISEDEIKVGYDALIHAREPQSMASMMYFMWYLLQNYGTDQEVTYLVNNREFYFVPCFNPDGYEYNRQTNPSGGGMWRKNRRNNGDGSYGVDLNRNFGFAWGYDNNGSSPIPSDETYRGPSAFSEPECQAVRNFALLNNYKTHFNLHSYQNAFLYPWGYINQQTVDSSVYREFASDMAAYNGFTYGTSYEILGYNSNGSVRDWMYGEQSLKQKTFGYTVEIGSSSDNFWPPQSRIFPLCQDMLKPNLYNAWVAGAYVQLYDAGYSEQFIDPGDLILMNSTFKNKGLATARNIQISLSSLNPFITIVNGTTLIDSIQARNFKEINTPLSFSVSPAAPVDVTAKILLTTSMDGVPVKKDTLSFVIGTPMFVFADTTNNPANLWTITASPTTPKWEATTSTFYSSPTCFTDSKDGNYVSNATVTMTLTNPVDLSSYTNPKLTFYTKYDIESNWDYGQVKASTNNGSTWIPLQGLYTEPGVGTFQPNGEPLYDGVRSNWVKEEISLAGFTSSQFKLRFELKTDGVINKDGWYLDDIGIMVYSIVPVELTSFTGVFENGEVKLNWQTASEINNYGFNIERNTLIIPLSGGEAEDRGVWKSIGFVSGNGTTTNPQSYSFVDNEITSGKYLYRLKQTDFNGSFTYSNEIEVSTNILPDKFKLEQNYPNPFNPSTKIKWQSPVSGHQTLKVYDVLGNEVATLVNEYREAGNYEINYDASALASGIYLYKLQAGSFISTKKMIYLK